jgi:uncharacterized membrane protein
MTNIHPFLVHFPIALLSISWVFDLLGTILHKEELTRAGWWTQLSGTIGLLAALVTGLGAKASVSVPAAGAGHLARHEQVAFVAAAVFLVHLYWRIRLQHTPGRRMTPALLVLSLVGLVLIWFGAWLGGELVYRFGVGVHMGLETVY